MCTRGRPLPFAESSFVIPLESSFVMPFCRWFCKRQSQKSSRFWGACVLCPDGDAFCRNLGLFYRSMGFFVHVPGQVNTDTYIQQSRKISAKLRTSLSLSLSLSRSRACTVPVSRVRSVCKQISLAHREICFFLTYRNLGVSECLLLARWARETECDSLVSEYSSLTES